MSKRGAMSDETLDRNYMFEVDIPEVSQFYFSLDEENKPIKLGDGTFGIVFEVYNGKKKKYAAKLMYGHQSNQSSEKRFEMEMDSARKIREKLDNENDFSGVIEIEGGSKRFHESKAYKSLQDNPDFASLEISNYVIVMPKYEKTLKQLLEEEKTNCYSLLTSKFTDKHFQDKPITSDKFLENTIREAVNSDTAKEEIQDYIYKVNGYEILRRMSFRERVNTILPYIVSVAQGLKTLHSAQLLHLDLKPANIFVKNDGQHIKTAVGDLGFLDEPSGEISQESEFLDMPKNPHYGTIGRPTLPLGTRHYRSPEQKDFFDVADVKVRVANDVVKLFISDPKFQDAIVEKSDLVLFSKTKKSFEIAYVGYDDDSLNQQPFVEIVLNVPEADLDSITEDDRTQVFFYKRQRHRTDLFGFGALVFELLSCGKSPEIFYESIRRYDSKDYDISSIMDLYKQVSNFRNTEPGLVQMFEVFQLDKTSLKYAPDEIVELILKCMMYKASGIFYSKTEEDAMPGSTMQKVLDSVNSLYTGKNKVYEQYRIYQKNPLYSGDLVKETETEYGNFWESLKRTQDLSEEKYPERLAAGIWHLERIIGLIQESISGDEQSYFLELTPQNINTDFKQRKSTTRYSIYRDEDAYFVDLSGDLVRTKVINDIANPFVPSYLMFMRREILLQNSSRTLSKTDQSNLTVGSGKRIQFESYKFLDSSLYGNDINPNDWVVVKGAKNYLLKISSCQDFRIQLEDASRDTATADFSYIEDIDKLDAVYYRKLDRCIYYLHMIGIYIYHLFFVGLADNTYDKPRIENYIRSFGVEAVKNVRVKDLESVEMTANEQPRWPWQSQKSTDSKTIGKDKLYTILNKLAQIYLKLILTENKDSYYESNMREEGKIFVSVSQDINYLGLAEKV